MSRARECFPFRASRVVSLFKVSYENAVIYISEKFALNLL